ncbi:MAG: hypothetical protein PHF11_06015 [Candidatus Omnitrophica bacterium]|nr:hypothetical protein [Candidatus Omnitrophota bacterium]
MEITKRMGLALMMTVAFITVVSMVFFALGLSSVLASDLQDQIAALEQESNDIQKGYDDLNGDIRNYNIVEEQLEANVSDNEAKKGQVESRLSELKAEGDTLVKDAYSFDAECANRTFYFERDRAEYNRCANWKSSIEARMQSIKARTAQTQNERDALNEATAELNQRTEKQKAALAQLNARESQLQARQAEWNRKYNLLINSPAFRQLVTAEGIANECKQIADKGDLEGAHHCLQTIWDGAK